MSDFWKNKDLLSSIRRGKEKKSMIFFGEWILEKTRWQTSDDADFFQNEEVRKINMLHSDNGAAGN